MKVKLKLNKKHPNNFMYFGNHTITYVEQELTLNKEEQMLLETAGPKHWFSVESCEAKKPEPKKETKKKVSKRAKK